MKKRNLIKPIFKEIKEKETRINFSNLFWIGLVLLTIILTMLMYYGFDKEMQDVKKDFAPDFKNLNWINSQPINMDDLKGDVVLVNFWSYSIVNCVKYLSYLEEWNQKYSKKGLTIIGIHSPHFQFEKDIGVIKQMMKYSNISYLVAEDRNLTTWNEYNARVWPSTYLIDKKGKIRFVFDGRDKYEQVEKKIRDLLIEKGESVWYIETSKDFRKSNIGVSKDIYLGYEMNKEGIGNVEGFKPGEENFYSFRKDHGLEKDKIFLYGLWFNSKDHMKNLEEEGILKIRFSAEEMSLIAKSDNVNMVEVFIDDLSLTQELVGDDIIFQNGKSFLKINQGKPYNILKNGNYDTYLLQLIIPKGVEIYLLTFD